MADQATLFQDVGAILEVLPKEQLVEITRRAALDGLQGICRTLLRGRIMADVVAELFPDLPPARVAEVTRQIGFNAIRSVCLRAITGVPGPWEIRIQCPDRKAALALRAQSGPTILVFWHFGPVTMLPLGLQRVGTSAMTFTRAKPLRWTNTPDMAKKRLVVHTPQQSIIAVRQALAHLKQGGNVAVALDGSMGRRDISIPFLGRQYLVSRGVAALARITGAPVVPCAMQWDAREWNMSIRIFEALPPPSTPPGDTEAYERAVLASAGRCFEAYGRQDPSQFQMDQLAAIMASPKFEG